MRTCHRALLPATLLLFIALAVLPASAFYNPNTGRWLSRDPIGEHHDAALYSFIRNTGNGGFDAYGLEFNPYVEDTSVEEIRRITPTPDYYGYTQQFGPREIGEDEIEGAYGLPADKSCCVRVRSAKLLRVNVTSLRGNNPFPNPYFSPEGRDALVGREDRRVSIYRIGFGEYLAPSELTGYHVTRCGIICGNDAGSKLLTYLSRLREEAKRLYRDWWFPQQLLLGAIEQHEIVNDLFIGLKAIYPIPSPPPFSGIPCPGESGWKD